MNILKFGTSGDIYQLFVCYNSKFFLQELVAYGVSNVIGSLFSSYCATGSISRSGFQATARGKTQVGWFIYDGMIKVHRLPHRRIYYLKDTHIINTDGKQGTLILLPYTYE